MTVIVAILACGFLVTSLAGYFTARSSLRSEITGSSLPLTSDNIYSEIQRDLLRPVFISSLMASDTFLRDWVISGERNPDEIVRYLREIRDSYGTVSSFFVSDRTGHYYNQDGILKTVRLDEPRDLWYWRVRDMENDYEINLDIDLANNDALTIFINYRVYDFNGVFIGATGVGLTVHAVKNLIEHYETKYGRSIFFIDRNGTITLRGLNIPAELKTLGEIQGANRFANEIRSGDGATFAYKRDHKHVYLNTRYIDEFDWVLLVEEVDTASSGLLFRTLLMNIVLSLSVTVLVFFILRAQIAADQNRLEVLAATDKLTGLYNRQAFDVLVDCALRDRERSGAGMALVMIDLDFFKKINDSHGHLAGDMALKQSSERIRGAVRDSDILCRWGGEEFLVLLKNCTESGARKVAEDVRQSFIQQPLILDGCQVSLTISAGVTMLNDGDTRDKAIARADTALYAAKTAGRNCLEVR